MSNLNHPKEQLVQPVVLRRPEHTISRRQIDENTLKVLYRLHRNGFKAYLVGGGVRDLLLNRKPKDFDVGTNATPQQVKQLFRNCFLVGRRFRLAHIRFGQNQIVEVATFRRHPTPEELQNKQVDQTFFLQNQFGTPREDAFRRDFTINALFYNIADFSIIDYVGGLKDLDNRVLRVIGCPSVRFSEDPVRMLRALEFSARLHFPLDPKTLETIEWSSAQIANVSTARLREEILDLFRYGVGSDVLQKAHVLGLFQPMMAGHCPVTTTFPLLRALNEHFLKIRQVDEAMLVAALFLEPFSKKVLNRSLPLNEVQQSAGHILQPYCRHFRLASGLQHQARELLVSCYRFARGLGHRGQKRFLCNPQTPRALDLFKMWTEVRKDDMELLSKWQQAMHSRHETHYRSFRDVSHHPRRRSKKRRGPKKKHLPPQG